MHFRQLKRQAVKTMTSHDSLRAQSRRSRDRFTSSIETGQEAAYFFGLHKSDLASVYCRNGVSCLIAFKERFEDVLCTDDGNDAVGCVKVMGRSACSIAVQALNVLQVGRATSLVSN